MIQIIIGKIKVFCLFVCLFFCHPVFAQTKAVDLGLSVKWADCNVGAENPSDAGKYFIWGDPSGMKKSTEIFFSEDVIGDITGTIRDIAKVNMGGSWRMPTSNELKELRDSCEWKIENLNGIDGFRVTGKNGASIFLPAIGAYDRGNFRTDQGAGLWSGTLNKKWNKIDFMLICVWKENDDMNKEQYRSKVNVRQATMRYKFNVRAVCDK